MSPNRQAAPVPDPHSERLEQSVLGACLGDWDAAEHVCKALDHDAFYTPAARDVFAAVKRLVDQGRIPDAVVLEDELTRAGQWERVCGAAFLDMVLDALPDKAALDSEIDGLLDYRAIRYGLDEWRSLGVGMRSGAIPRAEAAARMAALASAILPAAPERSKSEILRGMIDGEPVGATSLPLGDLESWLGPIFGGQKVVIAAETSVGKTAMMVTLWLACMLRGIPSVYLSLEDSEEEIIARATASLTWLTWGAILARRWSGDEAKSEARRVERFFEEAPGNVRYLPGCNRTELAVEVARAVTKHAAKVVIVDYVQAMADDGSSRNQQIARALGEISRATAKLAVLVVGSQLNRPQAGATGKPSLNRLRDSGVLEQDARAVILLSQQGDEVNDADGKPVKRGLLIDVAKNKSGRKGELQGTLWLRHSCLWTGHQRPPFYIGGEEEKQAPAGVQEDLPVEAYDDSEAF